MLFCFFKLCAVAGNVLSTCSTGASYVLTAVLILFLKAPSGPPQAVVANISGLTSFYVVWDPPTPEDRNGIIISYVVNITGVETGEQIQLTSDSESVNVTALAPNTAYFCIVAASTIVGTGPFSGGVSIRTLDAGT